MKDHERKASQAQWPPRKSKEVKLADNTFEFSIQDLEGLPKIQELMRDVSVSVQVDPSMVLGAFLGAVSVATQGLVDTQRPDGHQIPTSLMVLILAGSGARKSSLEKLMFNSLRVFQQDMTSRYQNQMPEYLALKGSHDHRVRTLSKELAKLGPDSHEFENAAKALRDAVRQAPTKPRAYKFLYQDASVEALLQGMADDFKYVGLVSSEGSAILKSRAFGSFASINSIWSGEDVDAARASVSSRHVSGGRLSSLIMVQQEALDAFVEAKGDIARGVGLWARFLVIKPFSTQGQRPMSGRRSLGPIMTWYENRLHELMKDSVERFNQNIASDVVELSPEAEQLLIQLHNDIEGNMQLGGVYEEAQDHASKLIENILRVAALLSYFEHGSKHVSVQGLKSAARIVGASSACFMACISHASPLALSAQALFDWLELQCRGSIFDKITKKNILQNGPGCVRTARKLDTTLRYLQKRKCITLEQDGQAFCVRPVAGANVIAQDVDDETLRSLFWRY